jgi:hypothetical protein
MGWLRKKFKQLKKKVKKILSTPWGRILGMVGMYFAMGAATKAFTNWWGSLGQSGTQAASKVVEVASETPLSEIGTETLAQGTNKTTFANNLKTSADNLGNNLLNGSPQDAANSAFSKIDTNLLTDIKQGNTEKLFLDNSVTETVSKSLETLSKPQDINVQDFLVENLDVKTSFPELGGGTVPDMTVAEYQSLGGEGPLLAEAGTGPSSVTYKGEKPVGVEFDTITGDDFTGRGSLPSGPFKGRTLEAGPNLGDRLVTATTTPPPTLGQRIGDLGKETWETFTDPQEWKALPLDIAKAGVGAVTMNKIMGEPEEPFVSAGVAGLPTVEAPLAAYVQDLSPSMMQRANIDISDPYRTASQLLTQNYTGTGNPMFVNQAMQSLLPFPFQTPHGF